MRFGAFRFVSAFLAVLGAGPLRLAGARFLAGARLTTVVVLAGGGGGGAGITAAEIAARGAVAKPGVMAVPKSEFKFTMAGFERDEEIASGGGGCPNFST